MFVKAQISDDCLFPGCPHFFSNSPWQHSSKKEQGFQLTNQTDSDPGQACGYIELQKSDSLSLASKSPGNLKNQNFGPQSRTINSRMMETMHKEMDFDYHFKYMYDVLLALVCRSVFINTVERILLS